MAITWKRSNEIVWEELDGEALLINADSGARWSLNPAASAIWKLCDGSRSVSELALSFARISGRCARQARQDVAAFCRSVAPLGLLERHATSALAGASLPSNVFMSAANMQPAFRSLGLFSGPRRRPTPRGASSPF